MFDGLDFKQAIARTPAIVGKKKKRIIYYILVVFISLLLEKVAISINPDYFRPPYVPVRQYMEFLMQQGLIDKQLGLFYLEGYEIARFSHKPLSQEQYMDIMKHLAAILQHMGYNLKNGNHNNNNKHHKAESINSSLGHSKSSRRSRRRLSSHEEDDAISTHSLNSRSSSHHSRKYSNNAAKFSHFEI